MYQNLVTNLYIYVIGILRKKLKDLFNLTIEYQGKFDNFFKIYTLK